MVQIITLIDKIQADTSTPEEELAVLRYLNDAAKLLVIISNEVKSDHLKAALKRVSSA